MRRILGLPPGRAAEQWLRARLALTLRATGVLDLKLRLLRAELSRAELAARDTTIAWEDQARIANLWAVRARVIGGARSLRHAAICGYAAVDVDERVVMGIRFPARATVVLPEPDEGAATPSSVAALAAVAAYRRSVATAAELAVAERAVAALQAEVAHTQRRLRALRDRWTPELTRLLASVQLSLDEADRADVVRSRWVAQRRVARSGQDQGAVTPSAG